MSGNGNEMNDSQFYDDDTVYSVHPGSGDYSGEFQPEPISSTPVNPVSPASAPTPI